MGAKKARLSKKELKAEMANYHNRLAQYFEETKKLFFDTFPELAYCDSVDCADKALFDSIGLLIACVAQAKVEGRSGVFITDCPELQSRRVRIMSLFPGVSIDDTAARIHGTNFFKRMGDKNNEISGA